jgi:uncharacterized membrane protein YhhN
MSVAPHARAARAGCVLCASFLVRVAVAPTLPLSPWFAAAWKASGVVGLAVATAVGARGSGRRRMAVAVAFGALGDVFLELDHHPASLGALSPHVFALGLGSFLVQHLLAASAFSASVGLRACQDLGLELVPLLAFAVGFLASVLPRVPQALQVAVVVYAFVLVVFAQRAVARARAAAATRTVGALCVAGALLFLFSDSCIAVNRFVKPFDMAQLVVMSTYYGAQALLVGSVLVRGADVHDAPQRQASAGRRPKQA